MVVLAVAGSCASDDTDGDATADAPRGSSSTTQPATTSAAPTTSTTGTPAGDDLAYPDPAWVETSPAAAGMDAAALEQAARFAEEHDSHCLVVTRHGELVDEWYWDANSDQNVFSATKSMTSAVVGIAEGEGLLDVDDRASEFVDAWRGTASEAVTIRDLLTNQSGRHWDFATDYVRMAGAARDKTALAVGLDQQHEPGTHWEYNNAAIQTLEAVLEAAIGGDVADYAEDRLFVPIGMEARWGRDGAGNAVMYSDVRAGCRDLARFGLLYLRGGTWADGDQVVPAAHVAASAEPSPLNSQYGYLWWLNRAGPHRSPVPGSPVREGVPQPAVPEDVMMASGLGGQIAVVFPSTGVVMARIGVADFGEALAADSLTRELRRLVHEAVVDP